MADIIPGQHFLTRPLVAARYSVSERTIARWQADAELGFPPAMQINGRHLFALIELEAWERARAACTRKAA